MDTSTEAPVTGGLTSQTAAERLAQYGRNDPAPRKRRSAVIAFLRLFLNPLVLVLLIAATASAALGEATDAGIIFAIVILSNTLDFAQTRRSQKAVEQLQAQVAPMASVLRDGHWVEIPCAEVVPGDVVQLSAGDMVPADARLLESRDLYVQQAALTGESLPAEKQARGEAVSTNPDAENMVFLGTSVVSGTARAVIVTTGTATAFGDIAARLAAPPEPTAFEHGLKDFSLFLTRTVFFLVLFLVVVGLVKHRDPFQSLLFAVALAVGLTPEFLPMIVSVTLANGARAMARKKVIVKHLAAIQNFGSIDVLCSDKTGTITSGHMDLDRCLDSWGETSARVLTLARLNSENQTGIRSPLDEAVLRTPQTDAESGYEKRDEIPYDFERRRLSVVLEHEARRLLITKGAPEGVLERTVAVERGGQVMPLDAELRARSQGTYQELSRKGLRVLAVAYTVVEARANYSAADERNLILAGFVTFADKPLPDAAAALAALREAGVHVKIITGDSDLVTWQVCTQVGLDPGKIVLGEEIEKMTDPALQAVAEEATVFARTSPAQKNRILLALKHRGHVVGFMGDGINDAPSLHAADVGISVASAVDVAREAADIILVEPGLEVLTSGILEGRKAFGNVMKYLLMGTSSNFGNMFSMAGASTFLPFLPMLPTQILLNNFLYDVSQITIPTDNVDAGLLRKPRQWDIGLIRKFMLYIGPISSIFDFLTFYVLLHFFNASEPFFHTGWFVESLATQTLVIYVIRTMGNPFESRPSRPLLITTVLVVGVGALLPFSGLAEPLGFVPLSGAFYLFVGVATLVYLLLVQLAKRLLWREAESSPPAVVSR
ncbi:MAG TPA: magnesium-translocating P-type ATPase [Steroidobacteraceae bacterium]|nr:magnesium-translocating P-type ATPase [Steroidobacteraceae bacterium]